MSWRSQGPCDLESEAAQAEQPVARRRVLFVTSEISDYVQTGGLGEVSAALPRALRALSDVRILVPGYRQVLDRAVARGEADPAKLTPRVVAVPFDLFRQELLMTLKAVPDEVAEGIVDEVFLPLVLTRPGGRG